MRICVVPSKPVDSVVYVEVCDWYKGPVPRGQDIVQQRLTGARIVVDVYDTADPVTAEVYVTADQLRDLQKKLTVVMSHLETRKRRLKV